MTKCNCPVDPARAVRSSRMFNLLIDTCVWLDLTKDARLSTVIDGCETPASGDALQIVRRSNCIHLVRPTVRPSIPSFRSNPDPEDAHARWLSSSRDWTRRRLPLHTKA